MTGMSRLSPLIVRRAQRPAFAGAAARPWPRPAPFAGDGPAAWLDDVRLFLTGWVGGLIFFGTLIG